MNFFKHFSRFNQLKSTKSVKCYSTSLNYAIAPDKQPYPLEGIRILDLTRIGDYFIVVSFL